MAGACRTLQVGNSCFQREASESSQCVSERQTMWLESVAETTTALFLAAALVLGSISHLMFQAMKEVPRAVVRLRILVIRSCKEVCPSKACQEHEGGGWVAWSRVQRPCHEVKDLPTPLSASARCSGRTASFQMGDRLGGTVREPRGTGQILASRVISGG